jgi:hypothetical protein
VPCARRPPGESRFVIAPRQWPSRGAQRTAWDRRLWVATLCAGDPGTVGYRVTSARLTAAGTTQTAGAAASAFGLPGRSRETGAYPLNRRSLTPCDLGGNSSFSAPFAPRRSCNGRYGMGTGPDILVPIHHPGGSDGCSCRWLPHPCSLPRNSGGSASASSLSRPAQASLALRPVVSFNRPRQPLSRGSGSAVTRPSRSSATRPIDNSLGGSFLHW